MQAVNPAGFVPPAPVEVQASTAPADGGLFEEAFRSVRATMADAEAKGTDAVLGKGSLHTAMIATTRADLSFRFLTQMRNKAVEAYRQMMSLQF